MNFIVNTSLFLPASEEKVLRYIPEFEIEMFCTCVPCAAAASDLSAIDRNAVAARSHPTRDEMSSDRNLTAVASDRASGDAHCGAYYDVAAAAAVGGGGIGGLGWGCQSLRRQRRACETSGRMTCRIGHATSQAEVDGAESVDCCIAVRTGSRPESRLDPRIKI